MCIIMNNIWFLAAEEGASYFLIITGFEDDCGWTDVYVEAEPPPSPPAPFAPGTGMQHAGIVGLQSFQGCSGHAYCHP